MKLSEEGTQSWDDRVDEVIGGGEPFVDEEYNRKHPLPTPEEIKDILREYEA